MGSQVSKGLSKIRRSPYLRDYPGWETSSVLLRDANDKLSDVALINIFAFHTVDSLRPCICFFNRAVRDTLDSNLNL